MSKVTEILDNLALKYKTQGSDYVVKCTNPEHTDSHPSMRIDMETGLYNCFSCGHKGNLLKEHGVKLTPIDRRVAKILKTISELKMRGLDMPEGYIPYSKPYRDISGETLQYFGAFMHPEYEDRLMFPLYNMIGELQCFIGRHMYSNLKDKYRFYPAHTSPPIFPAKPLAVYSNTVIMVEGIFDALNLIDKGLQNIITGFGLYPKLEHFSYLKVFGVEHIYIMFDGDKAGREGAKKLERELNKTKFFTAEVVELPDGVDPGDLTQEQVDFIKEGIYDESGYSRKSTIN